MVWLFAIAVLLLIVFVPAVRRIALVLVATAVIAIAYVSYQSQQEREASRKRVSPAEMEFADVRLGGASYTHELTGRVRNRSPRYTVSSVGMKIQVEDCTVTASAAESTCVVVGQSDASLYLDVPPDQVRDFRTYVSFLNDMQIHGRMQWSYRISYIDAK
jgi:hypothetical protein